MRMWSDLMAVDESIIGIDDDFFQRGGHSLKAAVLVTRVKKELDASIPMLQIFKTPTIRQLAAHIKEHQGEESIFSFQGEHLVLLRKQDREADQLFFLHDGTGGVDGYLEFIRRLDIEANCWGLRAGALGGDAGGR